MASSSVHVSQVTLDIEVLPATMFVLAISRAVGDMFTPPLDDLMIHLARVPFLDEEPEPKFAVLTAQDVMARPVSVLRQVEKVRCPSSSSHLPHSIGPRRRIRYCALVCPRAKMYSSSSYYYYLQY